MFRRHTPVPGRSVSQACHRLWITLLAGLGFALLCSARHDMGAPSRNGISGLKWKLWVNLSCLEHTFPRCTLTGKTEECGLASALQQAMKTLAIARGMRGFVAQILSSNRR